ncbi:hypothetical protein Sste5346_003479 [Sporothrix stenoceras]|uniref:Uncharacterized protein n=1 Tax=Sporothrix stenoceras TaxID=5173 RepID=A0ABR3ZET3_9PEZI
MATATAPDLSSLKDTTVIITGGASGMGLATTLEWAAAGAYVTIADVLEDAGQQTAADLTAKGQHVTFVRCDVSDWSSATAAFKHAIAFGVNGGLDVAALFAGVVGDAGNLTDQVIAAKKATNSGDDPVCPRHVALEVNFRGLYETAWLALYYMQGAQSEGDNLSPTKSLILVGSLGSYTDSPPYSDYNAAKFGVRGLFRGLRHSTPSIGVSLSLLAPWWVDTPMVRSQMALYEKDGVEPGKGMTFTPMHHVVNAASRCAVDPVGMSGKAILVEPEGYMDFQDDEGGKWGGDVLAAAWQRSRAAGDRVS